MCIHDSKLLTNLLPLELLSINWENGKGPNVLLLKQRNDKVINI